MNNWLRQAYGIDFKCEFGPSGNLCKGDVCGAQVCCQQSNGCNKCVGKL